VPARASPELIVAPGFIDPLHNGEVGVLAAPDPPSAVPQGVTTVIVGNGGVSAGSNNLLGPWPVACSNNAANNPAGGFPTPITGSVTSAAASTGCTTIFPLVNAVTESAAKSAPG
jgi:hypothetical protein